MTHWSRWLEGGRPHAAIALAALAAVGAALVTQHGFGMLPCPWCVLQRMIFVVIALVALPAAAENFTFDLPRLSFPQGVQVCAPATQPCPAVDGK